MTDRHTNKQKKIRTDCGMENLSLENNTKTMFSYKIYNKKTLNVKDVTKNYFKKDLCFMKFSVFCKDLVALNKVRKVPDKKIKIKSKALDLDIYVDQDFKL